jgi:hypothetical protein
MTDKALTLVENLCEACYQDGGDEKAACNALVEYIEELEQKAAQWDAIPEFPPGFYAADIKTHPV